MKKNLQEEHIYSNVQIGDLGENSICDPIVDGNNTSHGELWPDSDTRMNYARHINIRIKYTNAISILDILASIAQAMNIW